jgi:DNA-binding PadR family transcriptional regulator
MKRDLNLIRQLLLIIESAETTSLSQMHGLNPSDQQVQYHLRLLVDAGLVRGVGLTNDGAICVRLTWEGHELLELARNEQLWERAKRLVQDKMGGSPITAIRAVLARWAVMSTSEEERWPVRLPHDQHKGAYPANGHVSNGSTNRLAPSPLV